MNKRKPFEFLTARNKNSIFSSDTHKEVFYGNIKLEEIIYN
jgi:hypothetical protein